MFAYIVRYWRMECMYAFISQIFIGYKTYVNTTEMTKMDSYCV